MSLSRILVTGGAGYIGSHTCQYLAQNGFEPVTIDRLSTGHRDAVAFGPFEHLDLADTAGVERVLEKYRPRGVIHFAGSLLVEESTRKPLEYFQNNVGGTLSLLKAIENQRKLWNGTWPPFVFSSTAAVYGLPSMSTPTLSESSHLAPINPYGVSKWMVEKILGDLEKTLGFHSVSLRYFNAAGADLQGKLGERHEPETHLIPLVLDAACGRREHVRLYGRDYPTRDGTCVRDYIHVHDLASAHKNALEWIERWGQSTAFNLGTGKGWTVAEVIEQAQKITGRTIPIVESPRRSGDPAELVADSTRAQKTLENGGLGWTPKSSSLETIVQSAWNWAQKQKG